MKPEFQQTKSLDFDSKGKNGKLKIFHFLLLFFILYLIFCVLIVFEMKYQLFVVDVFLWYLNT